MKTYLLTFFLISIVAGMPLSEAAKPKPGKRPLPDSRQIQNKLNQNLNGSTFSFKANTGQWQPEILYRTYQGNQNVSFLKDRISFGKRYADPTANSVIPEPGQGLNANYHFWEIEFSGMNPYRVIKAEEVRTENVHYFGPGNPSGNKITAYNKVQYNQVYKGVDLIFYSSNEGNLKYDFEVAPGADIAEIRLKYNGTKKIWVDKKGRLVVDTKSGTFREDKPLAWQIINGVKTFVEVQYRVEDHVVSYEAGENYNPDYALIIDPVYLDWSTYFYGAAQNSSTFFTWTWVLDLDIDFSNHVYITGMTTDWFPYFPNAYDTSLSGVYDAFVCKMTYDGDSMLFFSYIGGTSYDYSMSMTVNQNEEPVISGITYSRNYPVTKNAFDTSTRNCGSSTYCLTGFVSKFNKTGTALIYSTFLGGNTFSSGWNIDWIRGMTMNASGEVYIVGNTNSSDFPITSGAYQTSFKGGTSTSYYLQGDAFLTKLKSDGSGLIFSTFMGGTNGDVAYDVLLSSKEEIYVVGYTASSNFPVTPGSKIFNNYVNGPSDAFFIKFKPDGSGIYYSKLMGGSGEDVFEGMYVNEQDELYVGGYSNSTDFYVTNNAYQKTNAGGYDFVVVKILSSGTNVTYSTYLGGSKNEYIFNYPFFSTVKIAANVREEAIICGITGSGDFPTTSDAIQKTNKTVSWGWGGTLCMAKLSMNGDKLLYGSFFGGSRIEYPGGIKVKRTGCVTNIIFGGLTQSADYPTTPNAFRDSAKKTTSGFIYTGFVSKFRDTLRTDNISLSLQDSVIECDAVFEILDAQNQGADFRWSHGPKSRYVIVKDTGTFWVEATYGCDTVRDTIHMVLEFSPKVPVLPKDTIYCNTFPGALLDAKNDSILRTYSWNTSESTQKINAMDTGLYIVTIQTPHCGTKSDSTHIGILFTPKVNLPKDSLFCDSVRLRLYAGNLNNACKYLWHNADTTEQTTLRNQGKYFVTATNICGSGSDTMIGEMLYKPQVRLPNDTTYCGNIDLVLKVGRANNEEIYNWSDVIDKILYGADDSVEINFTGYFKVEIENRCGYATDSAWIKRFYAPTLNLLDTSVFCDDVLLGVKIGTKGNGESYLWSDNSTLDTNTIFVKGPYWATVSNICGKVSDTGFVKLKNTPTVDLPDDTTFCTAVNYPLSISGNDIETRYYWNGTEGNASKIILVPGKVMLVVSNDCGSAIDSLNIRLLQMPTVELGSEVVYCGAVLPTDFSVGNPNNQETYQWTNGSTNPFASATLPGIFGVRIINPCGEVSDSVNIRSAPFPKVDLGEDTVLCGNFSLLLDAGNDGVSYSWMPTGETSRMITAKKQTTYNVKVTNADGCQSSDHLKIGSDCISTYYIPEAFTPNGDLLNDVFKPTLENVEEYSLSIFNRWGEKVYETKQIEQGWDGSYAGKNCEQGMYLYIMNFVTTEDMQYRQISGSLILLY